MLGSNRETAVHETDYCKEDRDAFGSRTAAGDSGSEAESVGGNRDEICRGSFTCEVTGAPKLSFPLGLVSEGDSCPEKCWTSPTVKARHSLDNSRDRSSGHGGAPHSKGLGAAREDVLGALRSLNVFAAGLAETDHAAKRGRGECCCGTAPYRMHT